MTFYTISGSTIRYPNKDEARKAILDRDFQPIGINGDDMIILGRIFNEDGIKCGEVLWNLGIIPDMSEYVFEDCSTNAVWPMNDDGTIFKDPYRVQCCHPDIANYHLATLDGPGFKTLREALKGF